MRTLSITEVMADLKQIIAGQTGENANNIKDDGAVRGRPNLEPGRLVAATNTHFFPRPLRGILGLPDMTVRDLAGFIDDWRDQQLNKLHKMGVPVAAKLDLRKARPLLAAIATDGSGIADGDPPAPLIVLSLQETDGRVKAIMGAQAQRDPDSFDDSGPVVQPNIEPGRLRNALNAHFFPGDLHGILGFMPGETIGDLADRIKTIRDPQVA